VGFDGKKSAINRARRLRKIGSKIPPPYPNGWYAIAESSEVKKGTAKSINCLGENFVVFRSSKSNEVFILDAYCPHLGANLGVGGIIHDDCIECPFHQWKFSGSDGSCVNIPYSDGVANRKFKTIS
jgi:cholesterol 7-desaturase